MLEPHRPLLTLPPAVDNARLAAARAPPTIAAAAYMPVGESGEVSHAALQQRLAVDGATITRLVKQFESEGMLSRRLDPQDNRYTLVSLTPSGQHSVAGLSEAHRLFQSRLLAGIPKEEQEMALRVLERVRANIHALQDESQQQP